MQNYDYAVTEPQLDYVCSAQEKVCLDLDRSMFCPYTSHVIVGRNASREMLFISCDRTASDRGFALKLACGVYACSIGYWPEFFVVRGEVHKIQVTGMPPTYCLRRLDHRTMFFTDASDMLTYDTLGPRSSLNFSAAHAR